MEFRKFLVAGALSCTLALSTVAVAPAFAVEFSDTIGSNYESSINKLVSLGVMKNPGDMFDPEGELTRAEFAFMVNQVMSLSTGKKVGFNDLSFKNSAYTNTLKMVNNGFLSVDKGSVHVNKGVTNAEMSKVLAQGLGLKKSWTNRPVDFLFYLVRKDVLDIDTDLDAVVTREQAAAAFDKFLTLKDTFTTDSGIVASVTETGFTLTNGNEYSFASDVSVFVSGQGMATTDVQVGSPATVILNKKGTVAYYGGELLQAETAAISLSNAKWTIGTLTKELNSDAYVAALPNKPEEEFSIKLIDTYSKNGVQFAGQAFFTNNDDVTAMYPYITKIEGKAITLNGNTVTVPIANGFSETFNISEEVVVTLDGKEAKLADLKGSLTATIEADSFGNVTTITATSAAK